MYKWIEFRKTVLALSLLMMVACNSEDVMKEKKITMNNEEIKYTIKNPKSNITCFLMHGFGDNQHSFDLVLPVLDSLNIKTVVYDIPGMGKNKDVKFDISQNLKLFSRLFKQEKTDKNIAIGHSMGGLIMLLSIIEEKLIFDEIIAVEPSLTNPDSLFFKYIQEPPVGIGMDAFINQLRDNSGYSKFYNQNVEESNVVVLKTLAKELYASFDKNRNKILNSELSFIYVYGSNSSGIEYRKEMSQFANITSIEFANAEHWVHYDAQIEFGKFLTDKITSQIN